MTQTFPSDFSAEQLATRASYNEVITMCRDIFLKKAKDYGASWRVMRIISIIDQIFIKAKRIRTLQEVEEKKVSDSIADEFRGIINYSAIGLIQLALIKERKQHPTTSFEPMTEQDVGEVFNGVTVHARDTMMNKNHDYGQAWREMSQESFADLILMKLLRAKQIISNKGETLISEGVDANFVDILNYAVFALILIHENKHPG